MATANGFNLDDKRPQLDANDIPDMLYSGWKRTIELAREHGKRWLAFVARVSIIAGSEFSKKSPFSVDRKRCACKVTPN